MQSKDSQLIYEHVVCFEKFLNILSHTESISCTQKIREKEIQTIQAFVLEPLRNVGLLLQNAQRSPHVFRMFIKFSWFVVISSKL